MGSYYGNLDTFGLLIRLEKALRPYTNADYMFFIKNAEIAQNISVLSLAGTSSGNVLYDIYLDIAQETNVRLFSDMFNISIDYADVYDIENLTQVLESNKYSVVCFDSMRFRTLQSCRLKEIIELIHQYGARAVVGNTYLTQALCCPTEFGADIVYENLSPYVRGKLPFGVIYATSSKIADKIEGLSNVFGSSMDPKDMALFVKNLQMVPFSMNIRRKNAKYLAERIKYMPGITNFVYGENEYMSPCMFKFKLKGGLERMQMFLEKTRHSSIKRDCKIGCKSTFITVDYGSEIMMFVGLDNASRIKVELESVLKSIYNKK